MAEQENVGTYSNELRSRRNGVVCHLVACRQNTRCFARRFDPAQRVHDRFLHIGVRSVAHMAHIRSEISRSDKYTVHALHSQNIIQRGQPLQVLHLYQQANLRIRCGAVICNGAES